MSHFYRLKTINGASSSNLTEDGKSHEVDFMYGYAIFNTKLEEISLCPALPHCKLYRAPLIQEEYIAATRIFKYNGKKAIPEIWGGRLSSW